MAKERPSQIQTHHLKRLAVLYCQVRRSQVAADSLNVADDLEDARQQAIEWGWPPARVIAIEDIWEASSPGASRYGLRRLRRLVAREEVGIIVTATNSCPPWLDGDLLSLLSLYQDANTLLAVNGTIVDPDEQIDHRLARIRASIAEYDNQQRTDTLMRAKRFHAARGRAVSRPPTGYIAYTKGQWKKDPAVSAQIAEVFRLYEALGSAGKVVRTLAANGFEMPLRSPAGELRWVRPTLFRIYNIITNPAYMGWYVFGRHARIRGALHRKRKTAWEERIVVRNHHAPYVTPDTWHRINQWLRRRAGRVH